MFDFSLGEMLVVALVALVVLGPERLPKAARLAGLWVRKARAHWFSMKNELEQELANEDLRRSLRESEQALRDVQQQLHTLSDDTVPQSPAVEPVAEPAVEPAVVPEERHDG